MFESWRFPTTAAGWPREPALVLGFLLSGLCAHAQTTVNFVPTSGFVPVVSGGTALTDLFDGTLNVDKSKQSSLSGANQPWDLVGTSASPVLQVATGTSGGAEALAFKVRLANYSPTSDGLTAAGGVAVLIDTDGNSTADFGVGVSFKSGTAGTFAGVSYVTPKPGTATTEAFQFTTTTLQTSTSYVSYTAAGTALDNQSGRGDALLTFVVLTKDIRAQPASSTFSLTSATHLTVVTNSGGTGLGSGTINADYLSASSTGSGALQFGTASLPPPSPVPEFPTAALVAAMIAPAFVWRRWWNRRVFA